MEVVAIHQKACSLLSTISLDKTAVSSPSNRETRFVVASRLYLMDTHLHYVYMHVCMDLAANLHCWYDACPSGLAKVMCIYTRSC